MTDEDRQRTMDFILEQQAQFAVNMDVLRQRVDTLTTNVDTLTSNVEGLREAQARTDETMSRIARQQEHMNEVVAVLADSQQHTDERLNALIDIVRDGKQ